MHTSTRLWLFVTMLAVLAGAQLLEHELAARRGRHDDLRKLRQALLAPLEPAHLPPIPGAEERPRLQTYTVKPGDTLGAIAQRFLGSSRAYPLLLELNRERIARANGAGPGRARRNANLHRATGRHPRRDRPEAARLGSLHERTARGEPRRDRGSAPVARRHPAADPHTRPRTPLSPLPKRGAGARAAASPC